MKFKYAQFLVLAAVFAAVMVAGCVQAPATPKNTAISARLDVPFTLGIGQSAAVEFENLTLKLINLSDSRCPSDVQCIQAGEAIAKIQVVKNGKILATFNLTTADETPRLVNGYSVSLASIDPYPRSTQVTLPSDYAVTLVISKEVIKSLSSIQQAKVSPSLAFLIMLKTKGGISPDSQASEMLSKDSASVTIEFKNEISRAQAQSLESSGVEFERQNGDITHTGRFYNAGIKWARMFEALDRLTAMPDVLQVDSTWKSLTVLPSS